MLTSILRSTAWISGSVLLFIVMFLAWESAKLFVTISPSQLFSDEGWFPSSQHFNLVPMLVGSLYTALGAVLIAIPFGIALAVYVRFYAPKLFAHFFRMVTELLTGVPSVVFGLWGLLVIVPFINQIAPPGASLLAGILVLALMILPLVAITTDSALEAVPKEYFISAYAMGLPRYSIIHRIILPSASSGIMSGIILHLGRALGETMAVLMVCGNVVQIPHSIFDPVRTLTANIALEMSYAMDVHRSALFVSGFILLLTTSFLVIVVSRYKHEYTKNA
ncbi:phosphate ABC transporter permease subunit PstC [Shewanella surugensis]|uniref:Phosphate transport system permease protein n=1 Tax=Shewanella surugensis TaxID=212020 RepID=A0ABT0L8D1_9GAMM|nr:phosphate ABC transporter permease subunit PstC [Shewanella surugensis]MCL1123952.1 phosphate ABC transporter permease subunit PstC [Shewanella surugensis]